MKDQIPKGKYIGVRVGEPPADEAEHFIKCEACGAWMDCRDLGDVFSHEAYCHRETGNTIKLPN